MGLHTASLRHSHVVMAPALTETVKVNFESCSINHLENENPIEIYDVNRFIKCKPCYLINGSKNISSIKSNDESLSENISNIHFKQVMSEVNSSYCVNNMCEEECKMGLQKTVLKLSSLTSQENSKKEKLSSPNLESVIQDSGNCISNRSACPGNGDCFSICKSTDGIKTISTGTDINNDNEVFTVTHTDLRNNLSPFRYKDILETVNVINMEIADQQDIDNVDIQKELQTGDMLNLLRKNQAKTERKLDFLRRRAHKIQLRLLGEHISFEISGIFENVYKLLRKPKDFYEVNALGLLAGENIRKRKPLSSNATKHLLRKLETTSMLQSNLISNNKIYLKYFGTGSIENPSTRNVSAGSINIIPWQVEEKYELYKLACHLKTQLLLSQEEVDSEATESSSGGESCDEMHCYNNPHQQYLSV